MGIEQAQRDLERKTKRSAEAARERAESSARNLQGGREVSVAGETVSVRPFVAIGIFLAVFVVLYLLTWTVLGGIGLAVGVLVGGVGGALAAKLYADRSAGA